MPETHGPIGKHLGSEALLIFLVPVYAYLLVNAFEFGYFIRLKIPFEFITIKLAPLAGLSLLFAFSFFLIVGILNAIYKLVRRGKDAVGESLVQLYIFGLFFGMPALAYDYSVGWILFFTVPMGLTLLLRFLLPAFKHKDVKGYWNKVELEYKKEHKDEDKSEHVLDEVKRRLGITAFRVVLLLISFLIISYFLGAGAARSQKTFLVVNTTPEQVVLRKNQDSFLCAEFDRGMREIVRRFRLLSVADISRGGLTITPEDVGPLCKPVTFGKRSKEGAEGPRGKGAL